jgi:hypothetical protein
MKTIYSLVAIGFFIYVPLALTHRLQEDFAHPERWADDPQYDPRVYLPVLGLTVVCMIAGVLHACHQAYRQKVSWEKLRSEVEHVIREQTERGKKLDRS